MMLDYDRIPMNANLTLNFNLTLNANITLNANLNLNTMKVNLALNTVNANLTFNAINATLIEHKYVNCKVRHLNGKIKSRNAKSITSNCTNNKSICNTKCFQKCTSSAGSFRSCYVKFICDKNPQNQLFFIGNYQHSNWLCCQHHQRERQLRKFVAC